MVKLNYRLRLLILVVVFIATCSFLWHPLVRINSESIYIAPVSGSHKFNATELNDFLILWHQLMQNKSLKRKLKQISLQNTEGYPWLVAKWLDLKGWNAKRFFYDEQRLKYLLSCIRLKKNLKTNIEVITKTKINLDDLISHQRQNMEACLFDEDEVELIENNHKQIVSIFTE